MLDDRNRLWLLYCTSLKLKDVDLIQKNNRIRIESPIMRMSDNLTQISGLKGMVRASGNGYVNGLLNNYENYCSNCGKLCPNLLDLRFK